MSRNSAVIDCIFPRTDTRNQQMVVISQLMRYIGSMHSIDQLFRWLAEMLVQRLHGEAVLFWAMQANHTGELSLELRTMMCKEVVPRFLLTNHQITRVADRMMSKRSGYWLYSVHSLFSPYHAMMLRRYGLNYCCGYYLEDPVLLPPANDYFSSKKVETPLTMAVLFFLREAPHDGLVPGTGYILEQALQFARRCGLVRPTPESEKLPALMFSLQQTPAPSSPLDLVPHRVENAGLMKVSNPLASSLKISSKQARRLFQAVDGRMTLRELMLAVRLDGEEIYEAIRQLLVDNRIALYEPGDGGKWVDAVSVLYRF